MKVETILTLSIIYYEIRINLHHKGFKIIDVTTHKGRKINFREKGTKRF